MADRYDHTILITTDTVGGVWSFSISLAESLRYSNSRIILTALGPLPNYYQREQAEKLEHVYLEAFESKLEWMDDPWESIQESGEWLNSLVLKYSPDLVHCNHYAHAHLNYNAPVVLTMHSCVKSWWKGVKKENAPDNWSRYGELVQRAINNADAVVAPTHAILNAYKDEYEGLVDTKVIYNGINTSQYKPSKKEAFVFCMGDMEDEAKNIKLLIEAAGSIDFPVYIAGKCESNMKFSKNVKFLGQQSRDQIREWMSRASIYIFPAVYEPFGISFLEAAASGCALVGGKISTLKEVWGDAALYVPQNEPEELATLVNVLMKDKAFLEAMRRNSIEQASKYNLQSTAEHYYRLYKSLRKNQVKH